MEEKEEKKEKKGKKKKEKFTVRFQRLMILQHVARIHKALLFRWDFNLQR